MSRLFALGLVACSPTMGDPRPVDLPTVVVRADADASPAAVGAAIAEVSPRVALVVGPADGAWFDDVAVASGLEAMSRPGMVGTDLGLAFLGRSPVGDTTVELSYEGGTFTVHDALYDLGQRRWLDLLSFRVETPAQARPLVYALNEYIATDVYPGAAIIMAVAVPSGAVADSVARFLTPMYRGAVHCGAPAQVVERSGVRLFYGPEARIFCRDASATESGAVERVNAALVVGRRR